MTTQGARLAEFVARVGGDPRVVGLARLRDFPADTPRLLLVSTWDGGVTLPAELSRLCAPLVGGPPCIEDVRTRNAPEERLVATWTGVGVDGSRAEVLLRRVGDLVPSLDGKEAAPLFDPRDLVEQWIRYCKKAGPGECFEESRVVRPAELMLCVDQELRMLAERPWRADAERWGIVREERKLLSADDPAQAALAARIDAQRAAMPGPGAGARVRGGEDPAAQYEAFLATADDEGFRGDRALFAEAGKRLRELSGLEPVFDEGFVVPTFDGVEASFRLGDAVAGTSLVSGVYVGVGVTPADHLEFWAGPFLRDAALGVGCVDDLGTRDVVARTAGRDALFGACIATVEAAWRRLPALVENARDAAPIDAAAIFGRLHLPRSFVERAKRNGADASPITRLGLALCLCRAGDGLGPLVARKFALAAGRVLTGR